MKLSKLRTIKTWCGGVKGGGNVNNSAFFAGVELPARVVYMAGHRGYAGVSTENLSAAARLCGGRKRAGKVGEAAYLARRELFGGDR